MLKLLFYGFIIFMFTIYLKKIIQELTWCKLQLTVRHLSQDTTVRTFSYPLGYTFAKEPNLSYIVIIWCAMQLILSLNNDLKKIMKLKREFILRLKFAFFW